MGVGGWGKIKIKDHLSPAEAEAWTEFGKMFFPEKSPFLVIIAISPIVAALLKQHVQLGRKLFHDRKHLFGQQMKNLLRMGLS